MCTILVLINQTAAYRSTATYEELTRYYHRLSRAFTTTVGIIALISVVVIDEIIKDMIMSTILVDQQHQHPHPYH